MTFTPTEYQRKFWERSQPFGVIASNGLNFRRSVNNPSSNLAKIIRAIEYLQAPYGDRPITPATQMNIIPFLGWSFFRSRSHGWGSTIFSKARSAGFITYDSKTHEWGIGPNAHLVKRY